MNLLIKWAEENNHPIALSEVFAKGGEGGLELAQKVIDNIKDTPEVNYLYDKNESIESKIEKICKKAYGASGVTFGEYSLSAIRKCQKRRISRLLYMYG